MILLAVGIAVLDVHTSLACLETDYTSPLLAATLGAAACCHGDFVFVFDFVFVYPWYLTLT